MRRRVTKPKKSGKGEERTQTSPSTTRAIWGEGTKKTGGGMAEVKQGGTKNVEKMPSANATQREGIRMLPKKKIIWAPEVAQVNRRNKG